MSERELSPIDIKNLSSLFVPSFGLFFIVDVSLQQVKDFIVVTLCNLICLSSFHLNLLGVPHTDLWLKFGTLMLIYSASHYIRHPRNKSS